MSRSRIDFGKTGEDLACCELERRGYAILARRYRTRRGELDIVARDGQTVVFVEVKARRDHAFGDAADAVHGRKRRRLTRLAQEYLTHHRLANCSCRFDVVSIHMDEERPRIEVYQNAFDFTP